MKVTSTEVPPRQIALDVEVEQVRLDRAVEEAFRRFSSRVNVPGFRKGKAPRALVERMVGREQVMEDALDHLVPEIVNEAIEQEKLDPYGRPRVESIELDPLRVRAVVPLSPKVELGDYQHLRVPREEVTVGADEVDAVVDRLRESYAQWVPVDRAAQAGDRVGLDVHGEMVEGGKEVVNSEDAEYVIDVEGPQPAPGFAEAIVGMRPGDEKTFTLTFADDYRDKTIAGQPAVFSAKLHDVKERQLPEVNDTFAQQVGEYADVAAMRSAIESQLREREEERVRSEVEEAALDRLVEVSTVDVPPQLVEHQADHLAESFGKNVEQRGLKLDQYLRLTGKDQETFRDEVREEANKRVRRSLALDAFAEAERIGVDPAEVEAEIRKAASATPEGGATEALALGNPTTMARIEGVLRERKALQALVDVVSRTDGGKGPAAKGRKSSPAKRSASDTEPESATSAAGTAQEPEEK